jgi:hypothetical protein
VRRDRVLGGPPPPRHGECAVHVARVPQDKAHRAAADRGGEYGSRSRFKNTKCIRKKLCHCSETTWSIACPLCAPELAVDVLAAAVTTCRDCVVAELLAGVRFQHNCALLKRPWSICS